MDQKLTRRALVGSIVGGAVAAGSLSPVRSYLERFAPFSGAAWRDSTDELDRTVDSPYGTATVRFDDWGTPHVEADSEQALYFAVGYVQAGDRLFQMDLQRRQMRGQLSEVVGDATLDSDEFYVRMDFAGAAETTWEHLQDTETGKVAQAYVDGVNACMENEPLPIEFGLLQYEPEPWTGVDSMLMEKQISWTLTGSFRTLRRNTVEAKLGEDATDQLYPGRLDHNAPIIRDSPDGKRQFEISRPEAKQTVDMDFLSWVSSFERPPGVGSNSWVVSGEHTEDGNPLLANDPHLSLMAPPVWYEMNLSTDELGVRGVMFPGVPFVVIGENDAGAWGFTNTGADVVDFYRYDIDGDRYRYEGEWREFDTEERTIAVAGGEDETVTVRKTVHGPLLEREGERVGVAWTGHTATATTRAVRGFAHSDGIESFREALRDMDLPTQNVVYADRDGNTLYYVTGRLPIRTVDDEAVPGNRIFDGSTGEGEWDGFEPFGVSSWDGFVPFEEKPHVENPEYIGTANQRVVDDPQHYVAEAYGDPYRGIRLYELMDERAASDDPMTVEFMKELQRDTLDVRARELTPLLVEAARGESDLEPYVSALSDWDYRMDRESTAALVFSRWFDRYRNAVFVDEFEAAGLDESYYPPTDWVVVNLDSDSRWFGDAGREDVMVETLREAVADISPEETYGDYNTTAAITHPFDQSFLNYDAYPTDGSTDTLNNYRFDSSVGSSWRMITPMDGDSVAVLPGGNSGEYFSEHYSDQLQMWADAEYRPMSRSVQGEIAIEFKEGGQ